MNRLTDRFGRRHSYLRISLTDRCNLRCTYCMPEHIEFARPSHLLSTDEIITLARIFVDMGINKIRLTGGEPLLHKDILRITEELSVLPGLNTLALTTNAIKLADMAGDLKAAGMDVVTVSLDSLDPETFAKITRRDRLSDVMKGIDAAIAAGFAPVKVNAVIMAGVNDHEITDFMAWGRDLPVELRFIEYMPFPGTNWQKGGLMPFADMRARIAQDYMLTPLEAEYGAVGKGFSIEGHKARVSFVTSMTESFCATCNRLRLTADGHIKSCLFHDQEESLRDILRAGGSASEIEATILRALDNKPAAHPPVEELLASPNRAMVAIGG